MNLNDEKTFWTGWYHREDLGGWVKDENEYDFQWILEVNPKELNSEIRSKLTHNKSILEIRKEAWNIIHSLPVSDVEKGKQKWSLTGIKIDYKDENSVIVVFYEENFDIYRETHIVLIRENEEYKYVNLYNDIA